MKIKDLVKVLKDYPNQDEQVVVCIDDDCFEIDDVDMSFVSIPSRVEINVKEHEE